ncbi:MAG: sulfite exporter TauE/SafE family protein [Betaproteobacteria bacterium]
MSLPFETLVLAALIVAGAYVIFGLTGFGSTVVAVPLLALVLPLKFAVPLMMLLDLAATLVLGARLRKGIRFDEVGWLVPFILAGMALGLTLLLYVAEDPLLLGLGVFVLLYAAYGFTRRGVPITLRRAWIVPVGLVGGALTAMFGTGGVIFAIYFTGRISAKDELRATNASMIMFSALVRVVLFGATGLLTQEGLLATTALLVPAMLAGFYIGNRLHKVIAATSVVQAVYGVLVLAGVSLIAKASA